MQGYGNQVQAGSDAREVIDNLEECLQLTQIFVLMGRLYQLSPLLLKDAMLEANDVLREANNRAKYDRPFTEIATNEWTRWVAGLTGSSQELCLGCAATALLPSKRLNLLELLKEHYEIAKGRPCSK